MNANMMDVTKSITRLESLARFKAMRLERGESAEVFGAFEGVSGSTVHRWENPDSSSSPSAREILHICMRCDISPTWLLFGAGAKHLSDVSNMASDAESANGDTAIANRMAVDLERLENAIERIELSPILRQDSQRAR
jgi:transcriptional regulator with XRE-family HTH domain